jgi:hypothetical protein
VLQDQKKIYEAELKRAEEITLTIKNATAEISKRKSRLTEYDSRRVAIENISKFVKYNFEEKKIRRGILESKKIEATTKLAAFDNGFSEISTGFNSKDNLFDLRKNAVESIEDLKAKHVYQYMDVRGQRGKTQANREAALLSHMMKWAIRWGITDHDLRAKTGSDAELEHATNLLAHLDAKVTRKHYRRRVPIVSPLR